MQHRLQRFRDDYDWFRAATVTEPRGSDVLVGGLLCDPVNADSAAGVIFFNNVGYLGMCGHGSIGLAVTLAYLERLALGEHVLETPAGNVRLTLHDSNTVSVDNVASYRYRKDVALDVPQIGSVTGDIAWGGNWFFLISDHGQSLDYENAGKLTGFASAIRHQLDDQGITGPNGEDVDHIELFGPPSDSAKADSRNFVLCPGLAYDRSPCGTGTSAKVACLIEDGKLGENDTWRQESITGSVFEATASTTGNEILPTIRGTGYVTSELTLVIDPSDPFGHGIATAKN